MLRRYGVYPCKLILSIYRYSKGRPPKANNQVGVNGQVQLG